MIGKCDDTISQQLVISMHRMQAVAEASLVIRALGVHERGAVH